MSIRRKAPATCIKESFFLTYTQRLLLIMLIVLVYLNIILLRNYKISVNFVRNRTSNDASSSHLNQLADEGWLAIKAEYDKMHPSLVQCSLVPSNLTGPFQIADIDQTDKQLNLNVFNDSRRTSRLLMAPGVGDRIHYGGKWAPSNCVARHRVAIVIPYKNRLKNLHSFLRHMHPFLQRQELAYQIFVVEQANDALFNKGILMNACFLEIFKMYNHTFDWRNLQTPNRTSHEETRRSYPFDCFIFHDVDLLPEDDRIMYSCPEKKPRHLSVAIDKYGYKMLYQTLIGGVLNFKTSHFIKANGYSNEYWGWGAEDDDMEARLKALNIGYERPNINIAHYKMLKHTEQVKNPERAQRLKTATSRFLKDGLNNVKYKTVRTQPHRLFTHILVDVGQPPPLNANDSVTRSQTPTSLDTKTPPIKDKLFLMQILANYTANRNFTQKEIQKIQNIYLFLQQLPGK